MTGATSGAVIANLPEHMSSPAVYSGVRVTRYLVLCVRFVDRCLSFCTFSFGNCIVDLRILITPLISSNSSSSFVFVVPSVK
jgi:hypothetical protein